MERWAYVLLSAADLSFGYRGTAQRVLEGVSIEVPRGSLLAVLGPNGSGKTTLLKLLAGILRPQHGRVTLDGRDLREYSRAQLARRIAVVPQEVHPAFEYTVLEMVLMGRYAHLGAFEVEGPEDVRLARDALKATGTDALEARRFDALSGGEKQRVVIAAALAQAGDVLLLDEPTASLDLGYQLEVAGLIERLNRERGVTIVLSTHDLNFAASVCRSVLLVRNGRVLATGPTDEVITPANIRVVYVVDADVTRHPRANHLTVVPFLPLEGGR
jgi:iron complex transport system ATP-binding protein